MNNDPKDKKITITDEQASRAAETLINAWLRSDDNTNYSTQDIRKDKDKK